MFSTRTSERTTERVLLVVQLVANPLDELFAPEEVEAARLAANNRNHLALHNDYLSWRDLVSAI